MNKKLGVVSMMMGLMLIFSAFAMIVHNNNEEEQAAAASDAVMPLVQGYIQNENSQEIEGIAAEDFADVLTDAPQNTVQGEQSGLENNAAASQEQETASPQLIVNNAEIDTSVVYVARIKGYNYIGYLTIPKLGLELPVMADWSYSRLKIAPCRYSGLHYGDDMVIAAHNYKRHFGDISRLRPGDTVVFTDMQGLQLVYTVGLVETLAPNEIDRMVNSEWDLTLFTCTYGGANRVTVRCVRV